MSVFVVATGGTIGAMPYDDPQNPPDFITAPSDESDRVRAFMEILNPPGLRYHNAGAKDSKLIDDAYRRRLMMMVENAPETQILITHGTDALLRTADFFFRQAQTSPSLGQKTILLTGAMVPLANGAESDGYLNLSFSLDLLMREKLEPGTHFVLCDYQDQETRSGWAPRLYAYAPGRYTKFFDPHDRRASRMVPLSL